MVTQCGFFDVEIECYNLIILIQLVAFSNNKISKRKVGTALRMPESQALLL
jgi:hypothetical protein